VSAVAVLEVDDPRLDWGGHPEVGAHLRALAAAGPEGALANGRIALSVLQLSDRAFALVAPVGRQGCWLTSLAVTYGRATRDEIDRDLAGPQAWLFRAASLAAEGLLRLSRADHAVYVNHLLFSTSLYGTWSGDDLGSALAALRKAYPDRAIIWRSLNEADHPGLLAAMDAQGARRLVSRIVWRLPDPARQWSPRTDVKADLKLVAAQGLSVADAPRPSPDDLRRVLDLYAGVYLDKYSAANPAYTQAFLRAAVDSGVLGLRLVRGEAGAMEAFAADHVHGTQLSSPMLGYDRAQPQSRGLYRVAMSLSVLRALDLGLAVNYSAGAGTFKRHRGAQPALEVMAVFDDHLPWWRRIGYGWLSRALAAMTPSLERIALK